MAISPLPDDPSGLGYEAARDLGLSLLDAQATAEAIPYLERAVALRPTSYVLVRLAAALRDLGRLDEALRRYEEALSLEGQGQPNTTARTGLAAVLCDMGDAQDLLNARELIQTVLDVEPENSGAHWVAHKIYDKAARRTGHPYFEADARYHKERAKELDDRSPDQRRSEQRLRAVQARRLRVELREAAPPCGAPEVEESPDSGRSPPVPEETLLQRFARWLAGRLRN